MSTNQMNCPYCNQPCLKQSSTYVKCAFCGKNFFSFCHEFPFEINKWVACKKCTRQLYYFFCFKCSKPLVYDKYRMGSESTCTCGFTGCYVICRQCNKQHCFPTGRYEGRPWKCQLCRSKFNFMTCDRCFREVYMDSFYEGQTLTCVNKKCNCRLTVKRCPSCSELFMDSSGLQYCQPCCQIRGINTNIVRNSQQQVSASWMSQAPVMSQMTQASSLLPPLPTMQSVYPLQAVQPAMQTIVPPVAQTIVNQTIPIVNQTIPAVNQTIPAVMQAITPPIIPQMTQVPQMPPLLNHSPQKNIPQLPAHTNALMNQFVPQAPMMAAKNALTPHLNNMPPMMPAKLPQNLKQSHMDPRVMQNNLTSQTYKPFDAKEPAKNMRSTVSDVNPDYVCKVCLDKKAKYINPVCYHMSACSVCVKSLSMCPVCRQGGQFQKVYV